MDQEEPHWARLARTQHAFTQWRLHKKHAREAIPETLWQLACELLGHFRPWRVASALKLNVTDLKQRAVEAGMVLESTELGDLPKSEAEMEGFAESPQPGPQFVEFKMPAGQEHDLRSPDRVAARGWRLVWSQPDGMRLEIHAPGLSMDHLQAIATTFVGG
ncbi:hypothetical protein SCOR_05715 [Sulfidibacter corallicola]|uniref:Uncharacterized protein n=1 Tax=Sulfidibacter corallicola TaxID=2818388 RepID=A0A8A4TRS6_SULCO|nr:hypothetical protein [Sulfidibacter corallicola]QTD51728.1 hypothetical protein J3U87_04595 [Sulfidibacter corallicola]